MAFLSWLQQTALAHYVQESAWGYPIVLSAHAVGMAILAGIVLMIDFRVLGFGRALPLRYFSGLTKLALGGFVLNLLSGIALFVADAAEHATNIAFITKIVLLIIGGVLMVLLSRRVFTAHGVDAVAMETDSARLIAGLSVVAWIGVIVAGRLIAYAK